jgi:hypothetical protein
VLRAQQAALAQEGEVALCVRETKTLALETRVGIVYDDDDGARSKVARVIYRAVTVKQTQAFCPARYFIFELIQI